MNEVAVLFARADSIYKEIKGCDVWDIERDARKYDADMPVVAHPPCRAWGILSHMAKPRHDEKELAFFALDQVRKNGGVLEHPRASKLWAAKNLPMPNKIDEFGGFTLPIDQYWFGHKAKKSTFLYIVGIQPWEIPDYPMVMGEAKYVICQNSKTRRNPKTYKPAVTMREREHTPDELAHWLVKLAKMCSLKNSRGLA